MITGVSARGRKSRKAGDETAHKTTSRLTGQTARLLLSVSFSARETVSADRREGGRGDDLLSRGLAPPVASALESFTTVCGMGTGGSAPLASPRPPSRGSGVARRGLDLLCSAWSGWTARGVQRSGSGGGGDAWDEWQEMSCWIHRDADSGDRAHDGARDALGH
jgi:hypothetical protein